MRTGFAALLWALAMMIPAAAEDDTVPCQVVATEKPCPADPQAQARWARKRLRDLDEQAETARLNRGFNPQAGQAAPAPQTPVQPPPPRQTANVSLPPSPAQYHSALEEYQALREAYDRQLRAYYRAFPAQAYVQGAPLPAETRAPSPAERAAQDAARAQPWHGYNGGLRNGY